MEFEGRQCPVQYVWFSILEHQLGPWFWKPQSNQKWLVLPEATMEMENHSLEHVSSVQNPCWLMIIGDLTTQYSGDFNHPIGEAL